MQKLSNGADISQMCLLVFGSSKITKCSSFSYGRSHENKLIMFEDGQQVVLKISKNYDNLTKQYALAQKLWRKLPVPRFISDVQQLTNGLSFAFLEFKHGERFNNIMQLSKPDHAQLGFELGDYLAKLHSQKFTEAGEFSSDLKVVDYCDFSNIGIADILSGSLSNAVKKNRLNAKLAKHYSEQFSNKISVIKDWQHSACLVHGNLNENNLMHNNGHLSAILDWEYAIAGHPALDFGKFSREPYISAPIFVENLCDSYFLTHKNLPPNWQEIAKLVDLTAWAGYLARDVITQNVEQSALNKLKQLDN